MKYWLNYDTSVFDKIRLKFDPRALDESFSAAFAKVTKHQSKRQDQQLVATLRNLAKLRGELDMSLSRERF